MFRLNAGVYRILGDNIDHLFIGILIQFMTFNGLCFIFDDAQILTDSNRSILVVTGNHDRLNAGAAALLDRIVDFRTARVDHSYETDEDQIVFEVFRFDGSRHLVILLISGAKNTQSLGSKFFILSDDFLFELLSHRDLALIGEIHRTLIQHDIQSTLGELDITFFIRMNG